MKWVAICCGLLAIIVPAAIGVLYYRVTRNDNGEYHPPGKVERRIGAAINACDPKAECRVRLRLLTPFDWDTAYWLDDALSQTDIENLLKTSYPQYVEMLPKLVFLKDGKIVYSEEEAWHLEKAAVNSVGWDSKGANGERFRKYSRDIEFTATRTPYENGYLYELNSQQP